VSRMLTPQASVRRPPDSDTYGQVYVLSYLLMRIVVGAVGFLLPLWVVLVDRFGFSDPPVRGSLSAYYYTGSRDYFVGLLCIIGVFLVAYKVSEVGLDNTLSFVAGLAAFCVAWFPTDRPKPNPPQLTLLQAKVGESHVMFVHYGSAILLLFLLGLMSIVFGTREGRRAPQPGKRSPSFWRTYHYTCGVLIFAAMVGILIFWKGFHWDHAMLIGEWISVWAFAASWLMKGLELDMLKKLLAGAHHPPGW
jgi:hypothetical protein